MIYITIRTDAPVTHLALYDDDQKRTQISWESGRNLARDLLGRIEQLLLDNSCEWAHVGGLVVYRGPGSFTGLRIGCTVANTMSYALTIPIVGEVGETWVDSGIKRITNGENDQMVMPEYGAEPRITVQKK